MRRQIDTALAYDRAMRRMADRERKAAVAVPGTCWLVSWIYANNAGGGLAECETIEEADRHFQAKRIDPGVKFLRYERLTPTGDDDVFAVELLAAIGRR